MDLDLDGRAYIITGGSSGLGLATASALVSEGARVLIVARDPSRVDDAVRSLGPAACGFPGDVADPLLADRVVARAHEDFGRLDGALVSVGGPPPGSVLTTTDDQWTDAFDTVFLGSLRLMRTVCRDLATTPDSGGSLAVVLSTSAVEVFPGLSTSNGLRPGLGMLVKDLADEMGPLGTRVNGLLPGRIATDRLTRLDAATGDPTAARLRAESLIPLRRYGRPDEFGRVAAFVLSPAASYITGSLLRVDGGITRSL